MKAPLGKFIKETLDSDKYQSDWIFRTSILPDYFRKMGLDVSVKLDDNKDLNYIINGLDMTKFINNGLHKASCNNLKKEFNISEGLALKILSI